MSRYDKGQPAETLFLWVFDLSDKDFVSGKGGFLKKEEKNNLIADLKERFKKANTVVFTDYKGLTVAELFDLRRLLHSSSIEYKVVKNTLARAASSDTPVAVAGETFKGPVGVVIGYKDPVSVAKKVFEYVKKNEKLKVSGGVVEGKLYGKDEIKSLAALPPREVMLSMIAGLMQAPATKMARALSATVSTFAYAAQNLKTKKESQN